MLKIFGLSKKVVMSQETKTAMELGMKLEKPIIAAYMTQHPSISVNYPGISVHPSLDYLVCSPDAIFTIAGVNVLVEVKTSKNYTTVQKLESQAQTPNSNEFTGNGLPICTAVVFSNKSK